MLQHLPKLLPAGMLDTLKERADASYIQINQVSKSRQLPHIFKIPHGGVYVKSSASFTLEAVLGYDETLSLITEILSIPQLLSYLPESYFVNLDQAWVRRQFPLHISKTGAHQWHQDGALGYNFLEQAADLDHGLLDMLIIWVPLVSCGTDAPGLEFINFRQARVLGLTELNDVHLKTLYPPDVFLTPKAEPGDVLVFGGNMIHRTHKTTSMTNERTSLGIRVFSSIPNRCSSDRHVRFSK